MIETVHNAWNAIKGAAEALNSVLLTQIAVIVLLLLFCFVGYKLLRGYSALIGLGTGAAIVMLLFGADGNAIVTACVTVVAAVLLGLLSFRFYKIGIFLIGAAAGAAAAYPPALILEKYSSVGASAVIVLFALLFGVTGVLFLRQAGILATAVCGFGVIYPLCTLLGVGTDNPIIFVVAGLVLTICGIAAQVLTNRSAEDKPWLGNETEEATEEVEQSEILSEERPVPQPVKLQQRVDEVDGVSDATQVLNMQELLEAQQAAKEKDTFDYISDSVAEHIGVLSNTQMPISEDSEAAQAVQPQTEATNTDKWELLSDVREEPQAWETLNDADNTDNQDRFMDEPEIQEDMFDASEMLENVNKVIARKTEKSVDAETMLENISKVIATTKHQDDTDKLFDTSVLMENVSKAIGTKPKKKEIIAEPQTEAHVAQQRELPTEQELFAAQQIDDMEQAEISEAAVDEPQTIPLVTPVIEEPQPTADQTEKQKRNNGIKVIFPIALIAAGLAAAAFGSYYIEIVCALSFICYALRYYRIAAFAYAILCVRHIIELVLLVLQSGTKDVAALAINIAVAVICLLVTVAMLYFADRQKNRKTE